MEATFCLSRHLRNVPTFAPPHRNRATIFHAHVNGLSFHCRPSLPSRPLQAAWPVRKANHLKTWAVNSRWMTPKDNGGDNGNEKEEMGSGDQMGRIMGINERALHALLEASEASEDANGSVAGLLMAKIDELMKGERIEYPELEKVARKLKMSDKANAAVKMLQDKYEAYCNDKLLHEAYELGLILVEMLIYQGSYVKAIKILQGDCYREVTKSDPNTTDVPVEHFQMMDGRPELYRAAAYTMFGNRKEAERNWDDFQEKAVGFFEPPTADEKDNNGGGLPEDINIEFSEFEAKMKKLKRKIRKARKEGN